MKKFHNLWAWSKERLSASFATDSDGRYGQCNSRGFAGAIVRTNT